MIQLRSAQMDYTVRVTSAKTGTFAWMTERYRSINRWMLSMLFSARAEGSPLNPASFYPVINFYFSNFFLKKRKGLRIPLKTKQGAEHRPRLKEALSTVETICGFLWGYAKRVTRGTRPPVQFSNRSDCFSLLISLNLFLLSLFSPSLSFPALYLYLGGCVQAFGDDVSCGNLWIISTISQHVAFLFCSLLPCSGDWY